MNKRVVISERNDPARQVLAPPYHALRPVFYKRADAVTANTRGALETMSAYVERESWCGSRTPSFHPTVPRRPRLNRRSALPSLMVGRLHWQKAHDLLFKAFARLPSDLHQWRLTVMGRGDLEKPLRSLAKRLGIAERIDWLGQVDDPYPYYAAADIFVLPSRHEGMPNALLEAMTCGMAVIVSDASPRPPGIRDR